MIHLIQMFVNTLQSQPSYLRHHCSLQPQCEAAESSNEQLEAMFIITAWFCYPSRSPRKFPHIVIFGIFSFFLAHTLY